MLLPVVKSGSVIVMDNVSFHQKKTLLEMAQLVGCSAIFLLPYSPNLYPIETFWPWLKAKLKKILPLHEFLADAIKGCFKAN